MTLNSESTNTGALDRYLQKASGDTSISTASYLERGSALVSKEDIRLLRSKLPELRKKVQAIHESDLLKRRLGLLQQYFEEAIMLSSRLDGSARDVSFALYYFLKGYDRIPDSIPEIGLLDDSIIVETVLQWHETSLKTHWEGLGRVWPAEV